MKDTTIEDFTKITKFSLGDYLDDVDNFFKKNYPLFITFYSGQAEQFNQNNYKILNYLIKQSNDISSSFGIYSNSLKSVDFWELLDFLEDIRSKLLTVNKIDKYLRSSITPGKTTLGIEYDYTLNSGQTIENVSRDILATANPDNDWTDTALRNDLKEVDWSIDGGKHLKLVDGTFQANIVTTMVDNTIGERIYGKDIDRNISFKDNDLKTLTYKETVFQAVDILSALSKGDVPEFPTLGINSSAFKGSNFNLVGYPSLIREYNRLFQTDDLFVDFIVTNLSYQDGDISVDFSVGTKFDLVVNKTATI